MTQTLNVIHVAHNATVQLMHGSMCTTAVPPYLVNHSSNHSETGRVRISETIFIQSLPFFLFFYQNQEATKYGSLDPLGR